MSYNTAKTILLLLASSDVLLINSLEVHCKPALTMCACSPTSAVKTEEYNLDQMKTHHCLLVKTV